MNNTYNIEELKKRYGYSNTPAPQNGEYDIESLKKQYGYSSTTATTTKPVIKPTPVQEGASSFDTGARKTLNTLSNIGEGAGLSIGKTLTGIGSGLAGIVGAKGLSSKIKGFGEKAFVNPTQQSQQTFAGKVGKGLTDVAQFAAPITKVGKIGTALNIGKDILVGTGQTGGNIGSGLAAGATTALTGGLNKLPQATGLITKGIRTLAPGYSSDVAYGISGDRGEDRTGGKALIPGAGSLTAGAFGVGAKILKGVAQNVYKPEVYKKAVEEWKIPSNEVKSGFNKPNEILKRADIKGYNLPKTLVDNGIFAKDHIVDGVYKTLDTADVLRNKAAESTREVLLPKLESIRGITPKLSPDQVALKIKSKVQGSKFLDALDKDKILSQVEELQSAWRKQFPNGMDIVNVMDEKILGDLGAKYSPVGDIATNLKANRSKFVADTLRKELEDMAAGQGLDLKGFNGELTKIHRSADYLAGLDGKKPTQSMGERISSKLARGAGALIGAKFGAGLLPTMAGYNIAGALESGLTKTSLPIGQKVLKNSILKAGTKVPAIEAVKNFKRRSPLQKGSSTIDKVIGVGSGLAAAAMLGVEYNKRKKEENKTKSFLPKIDDKAQIGIKKLEEIKNSLANNETGGVIKPYSLTKFSGDSKMGNDNGKYQITDAELKTYAPRYLGRKVTREEFLASPELQEEYIENKILNLNKRGLTIDEIFGVHRYGGSDLTKAGLKKTTTKAKDYIAKAKNYYYENRN